MESNFSTGPSEFLPKWLTSCLRTHLTHQVPSTFSDTFFRITGGSTDIPFCLPKPSLGPVQLMLPSMARQTKSRPQRLPVYLGTILKHIVVQSFSSKSAFGLRLSLLRSQPRPRVLLSYHFKSPDEPRKHVPDVNDVVGGVDFINSFLQDRKALLETLESLKKDNFEVLLLTQFVILLLTLMMVLGLTSQL